ncbi:MAG: hypothetical protein ACXWKH_19905 [Limisphaerales bacterium]
MAKAITLNASLKWRDVKDDYVVRYEGHLIGRIRLGGERYSQGNTWEWSIDVPMAMPAWARGSAESRDACMKDFTAAWGRFLKATSPERLARALELERAFAARYQRMGLSNTDAA